jgi:phosphoribulokinase
MVIEPLAQLNMTSNSYVAVAYNWRREYVHEDAEHIARNLQPITQTQWVNVRVGMTF